MRRGFRFLRDFVIGAALLVFGLLIAARLDGGGAPAGREVVSGPFRVSDGDTLGIGRQRYRLSGIDAPELRQICRKDDAGWACGEAARRALLVLVQPSAVRCEGDVRDRYGRLLVICRDGASDINARMVLDGMAVSYPAKGSVYRDEEAQARRAGRGLWASSFERPQDWRRVNGDMEAGGLRAVMEAIQRFFGVVREEDF